MKKIILAASVLAVMTGAVATAATMNPVDYRRTLFAPVGQEMLMLEAPRGMCFLDNTKYVESSVYKVMAAIERKKGKGVLLGIFAPCDGIANIGNAASGSAVMTAGTITWLNPSIGEKTKLERHDYLDMREASFKDDVRRAVTLENNIKIREAGENDPKPADIEDFDFDTGVKRTDAGLWLGYVHEIHFADEKIETVSVSGTTSLRHFPIEVNVHINSKQDGYDLTQTHELMDKFMAQQVALNE